MDDGEITPPTEPTGSILDTPPPAPRASGARVAIALGVVAAVAAAATVIVLRAGSSSPSLASKVPATAVGFIDVALRPSGAQRDALGAILDRLPEERRARLGDEIDGFLTDAFEPLGLDYRTDVKPWVGGRAGLVVPTITQAALLTGPDFVGMLEVRDEAAARAALQRVFGDGKVGAFTIADGIAYIGRASSSVDAFIDAAAKGAPLSENAAYKRELASVGDDYLAFVWFDGSSLGPLLQGLPQAPGTPLTGLTATLAAALRATGDGIEFVGHSKGGNTEGGAKAGRPALLESTGAGLLGSLTIMDIGTGLAGIDQVVGQIAPFLGGVDPVEQFEDEAGFDIAEDLVPWLHGETSIVVGGFAGFIPDVGVLIEPTNEQALDRTFRKAARSLRALAADEGFDFRDRANGFELGIEGVRVTARRGDGRVVIATSPAYAGRLLSGSSPALGDDAVYRRAVGDNGGATVFQLFVRLDRVRDLAEAFIPPDERPAYDEGPGPFLQLFEAFAVTATLDGDEGTFRMIATLAD